MRNRRDAALKYITRYISSVDASEEGAMSIHESNHHLSRPSESTEPTEHFIQGQLFDPDLLTDFIRVEGSLRADPIPGMSLADVLIVASSADPDVRCLAAASRWNSDARVQRLLAVDSDEWVVRAFIDATDPGLEACRLIIAGPHVSCRQALAQHNLCRELLERLAVDSDAETRASARATLARRRAAAATPLTEAA